MRVRPLSVMFVALALLLPTGLTLVGPGVPEAQLPVQAPEGGIEIFPHAPLGEYTTLRELNGLVRGSIGLAAEDRVEPLAHYAFGTAAPDHTRWLREVHAGGFGPFRVVDGVEVAYSGTVLIDTDVKITGAVTYNDVEIIMKAAPAGHRTIEVLPGGSLTITNSLVRNDNGDRLDYGIIQARGALLLDNNRFEQVMVYAQDNDPNNPETQSQTIRNNFFTNSPRGVLTDRDGVLIQDNVFFKNNIGVFVASAVECAANSCFLDQANPQVIENTFEMNEIGIRVDTDQNADNGEVVGLYRHNLIRANIIGVQCYSAGWYDPANPDDIRRPRFESNNIYTNWGDALNNLRGITIIVPFVGPVGVSDSSCHFTGNHYGADSLFLSSADLNQNVQANPVSLPSTPALPFAIVQITSSTTWNAANPPPAITGPVVVRSPAVLTVNGITLASDFTIGATKGGRISLNNVDVNNANGIVMRNDNDEVINSRFRGTQLFDPLTIFRNNATVRDSLFEGSGRDRNVGVSMVAGQFTEDFTWSPKLRNSDISNAQYGVVAVTQTVTMNGTRIHDIGMPEDNYPLQLLLSGGFAAVIVTLDSDDNRFERVGSGYSTQLLTLDSARDVYDGGMSAFNSALLNTLVFDDAMIANFEFGLLTALESSLTMTDSNITHNGHGIFAALFNPTITGTNLWNNAHYALYPYTTDVAGQTVTVTMTCTNCHSLGDESRYAGQGSSVAYTASLGANSVPQPSWKANIREISGNGNVLQLDSGTLAGPVIARNGGEIRIENEDINMAGKFVIAAKGGGQSGGATGRLTVSDTVFTNGGFLAWNSTAASVRNSHFRGFTSGAVAMAVAGNGGTIECNNVNMAGGYPGRLMDQRAGASPLQVTSNRFTSSGDFDVGTGLAGDVYHRAAITFERNSMVNGTSGTGAIWVLMNGTASIKENNFLSNSAGIAARSSQRNYSASGQSAAPPALKATDVFWGAANGGKIFHGAVPLHEGDGLRLNTAAQSAGGPRPEWSPFKTTANAFDPCVTWRFGPKNAFDWQTVNFDADLSFDPSGLGIASYSWDFNGEGSSTLKSPSFKFPDGGTKSVTLTVTTEGGRSASRTRTVNIVHSNPVADFTFSGLNEDTPVAFTDTSTHPNAPVDAPPNGWTYAWNFNGQGTSSQRNPSFKFPDGGAKTVTLTVTDNDGMTNQRTRTVNVAHVPPVANFNFAGSLETDTFQLTDTSTHPNGPPVGPDLIVTRAWSCSDGFTSSQTNPTHKFADGGTYSCTLTVTDDDGLSNSVTRSIPVSHVDPVADFAAPTGTELQTLAFSDASTHPNSPVDAPPAGWTYAWVLGDGAVSSQRNPQHRYADGGSYQVQLTVTDNDGRTSSITRTTTVTHVRPVAAFSFDPPNGEIGEDVQFTDASTHPNAPNDAIVSWLWDFGDGATSTLQNPAHAFTEQGIFDVTLTVTDDDGQSAQLKLRVPVGNLPPVAAFSHSPVTPTDLEVVQFTDESTDADGEIVSWAWDFGDGSSSTEQNPSHQFMDDGTYTVSLTVTDNLGADTTLAVVIEVLNVAPTAGFGFNPQNPVVGKPVQFMDTSGDPDGSIVTWAWSFGDGSTSNAQNPSHTYTSGGDYTVRLTVTDDDGAQSVAERTIHVCETSIRIDPATLRLRIELCPTIEL